MKSKNIAVMNNNLNKQVSEIIDNFKMRLSKDNKIKIINDAVKKIKDGYLLLDAIAIYQYVRYRSSEQAISNASQEVEAERIKLSEKTKKHMICSPDDFEQLHKKEKLAYTKNILSIDKRLKQELKKVDSKKEEILFDAGFLNFPEPIYKIIKDVSFDEGFKSIKGFFENISDDEFKKALSALKKDTYLKSISFNKDKLFKSLEDIKNGDGKLFVKYYYDIDLDKDSKLIITRKYTNKIYDNFIDSLYEIKVLIKPSPSLIRLGKDWGVSEYEKNKAIKHKGLLKCDLYDFNKQSKPCAKHNIEVNDLTRVDVDQWKGMSKRLEEIEDKIKLLKWNKKDYKRQRNIAIKNLKEAKTTVNLIKNIQVAHTVFPPGAKQSEKAKQFKIITDQHAYNFFSLLLPDQNQAQELALKVNPIRVALTMSKQVFAEQWAKLSLNKPELSLLEHNISEEILEGHQIYTRMEKMQLDGTIKAMQPNTDSVQMMAYYSTTNQVDNNASNWDEFFPGSLTGNYCDCPEYRNVWSPAAYVVDMLLWFFGVNGQDENGQAKNGFFELIKRRPDIVRVVLSESNSYRKLPYIDIENEVLEYHYAINILGNDSSILPDHIESQLSEEELLAIPEIHNTTVYEAVYNDLNKNDQISMQLPFDLALTEARLWSKKVGKKPFHQLLELYAGKHSVESDNGVEKAKLDWGLDDIPAAGSIVKGYSHSQNWQLEYLGLTPLQFEQLTTLPDDATFKRFFNSEWENISTTELLSYLNNQSNNINGPEVLINRLVPDSLYKGVDSSDYFMFLHSAMRSQLITKHNNGVQVRNSLVVDEKEICSLDSVRLNINHINAYKHLYLFMRLLTHLDGWQPWQLNWVLGDNDIDETQIRNLAFLKRLSIELNAPIEKIIFIWQGFYRGDSYLQQQQTKVYQWTESFVRNSLDASSPESIAKHYSIDEFLLTQLLSLYRFNIDENNGGNTQLEKIARLMMFINLEFLNATELLQAGTLRPLFNGKISELLKFVLQTKLLKKHSQNPYGYIAYLSNETAISKPSESSLNIYSQVIAILFDWLLSFSIGLDVDDSDESKIDNKPIYQKLLEIVDKDSKLSSYFNKVAKVDSNLKVDAEKLIWKENTKVLSDYSEKMEDKKFLLRVSEDSKLEIDAYDANRNYGFAKSLSSNLRQKIENSLFLEKDKVYLFDTHTDVRELKIKFININNENAQYSTVYLGISTNSLDDSPYFETFNQFYKAEELAQRYDISGNDIDIISEIMGYSPVELNKLSSNRLTKRKTFENCLVLSEYSNTLKTLGVSLSNRTLFINELALIEKDPAGDWIESEPFIRLFAKYTHYTEALLEALTSILKVKNSPAENPVYSNQPWVLISLLASLYESLPNNLDTAVSLLPHRDYSPSNASYENHPIFFNDFTKKRNWLDKFIAAINQSSSQENRRNNFLVVNNVLRVKRRDALANALVEKNINQENYSSLLELKEYLLLPSNRGACRQTSRIREVMSVINRFGEKIYSKLLNPLSFTTNQRKQWLKYRSEKPLWQARVEIAANTFLYALPETKRVTTEIYDQRKSELEQSNIDGDAADDLTVKYVDELHKIGNLEQITLLNLDDLNEETKTGARRSTYYFARTYSIPHEYYFCKLEYNTIKNSKFYPWQKIELDIDEPHLLPFVFKGSLYLFWPSIKVEADKTAGPEYTDLSPEQFRVSLNYSRYFDGKWLSRKKSEESIVVRITSDRGKEKLNILNKKHRIHLTIGEKVDERANNFTVNIGFWEKYKANSNPLNSEQILANLEKLITDYIDRLVSLNKFYIEITLSSFSYGGDAGTTTTRVTDPGLAKSKFLSIMEWYYNNIKEKISGGDIESAYSALEGLKQFWIEAKTQNGSKSQTYAGGTTTTIYKDFLNDNIVDLIISEIANMNLRALASVGPDSELVYKGEFVFDSCGDIRLISTRQFDIDTVGEYLSGYHELIGTDMHSHRMIENIDRTNELAGDDSFSVYRSGIVTDINQVIDSISESRIFYKTPTQFTFVPPTINQTIGSTLPFKYNLNENVDYDFQTHNNAVFQDRKRSFSILGKFSKSFSPALVYPIEHIGRFTRDLTASASDEVSRETEILSINPNSGDLARVPSISGDLGGRYGLRGGWPLGGEIPQLDSSLGGIPKVPDPDEVIPDDPSKDIEKIKEAINIIRELEGTPLEWTKPYDVINWYFRFELIPLYHPYTCDYKYKVEQKVQNEPKRKRIDRLYALDSQLSKQEGSLFNGENSVYQVQNENINYLKSEEDVNFHSSQLYSEYNWELFYHLPFYLALKLAENQEFESAYRYFHYIFDPFDTHNDNQVWRFRPFRENINQVLLSQRLEVTVDDPFNPHAIARRDATVYKKAVVMKYIDTLIEEGDSEFLRYTGPSLERAEQKYNLALKLLGREPQRLESGMEPSANRTFFDLIISEDIFPFQEIYNDVLNENLSEFKEDIADDYDDMEIASAANRNYFCLPNNPKIQEYFKLLKQRKFNLDNCRDINGEIRELPLYQPRIDPWLVIEADMAGYNLKDLLVNTININGLKFEAQVAFVTELINTASSLNSELLLTIQQKESKALETLREKHQNSVLNGSRQILRMQIESAENTLSELERTLAASEFRRDYYANQPYEIPAEKEEVSKNIQAQELDYAAQSLNVISSVLHIIPDTYIGFFSGTKSGGSHFGLASAAAASGIQFVSSVKKNEAYLAGVKAGRQRRAMDWKFQADSIEKDIRGVEQQILGAKIRINIAEKELDNLENQIEQSNNILQVLSEQYTNEELYRFMESDIRKLNKQAFQMAYDACLRLQEAYRFETWNQNARFIKFINWSSPKHELMAGKNLQQQVNQMREAYNNDIAPRKQRGKTFKYSMVNQDADKFVNLLSMGREEIEITGKMFDRIWPNHYHRRLKSLRVSVPGVIGPHTTVNGKIKLIESYINTNESNFDYSIGKLSKVDNSTIYRDTLELNQAVQDNGLLQFEETGQRYNIMEGAGLDNFKFTIELDPRLNIFDLSTIPDVEILFEFTALDSNSRYEDVMNYFNDTGNHNQGQDKDKHEQIKAIFKTQIPIELHSIKHSFPSVWRALLDDDVEKSKLKITPSFPVKPGQKLKVTFSLVPKGDMQAYDIVEIGKTLDQLLVSSGDEISLSQELKKAIKPTESQSADELYTTLLQKLQNVIFSIEPAG